MFSFVILLISSGVIFLASNTFYDAKRLLKNIAIALATSSFFTYVWFALSEDKPEPSFLYLLVALFLVYGIYYVRKCKKSNNLKIVAKQQRYFDEVNADMIYNFYQDRLDKKDNRIEVKCNEESMKFFKYVGNNEIINTNFFLELKNLELSKISSTKEMENFELYNIIYKKILGFIKETEKQINFEEELKNNGNYAEFLILDLWERFTYSINISVANLQILAKDNKDLQLLGAINNVSLSNINLDGSALYFAFMDYKNRIKEYLE